MFPENHYTVNRENNFTSVLWFIRKDNKQHGIYFEFLFLSASYANKFEEIWIYIWIFLVFFHRHTKRLFKGINVSLTVLFLFEFEITLLLFATLDGNYDDFQKVGNEKCVLN